MLASLGPQPKPLECTLKSLGIELGSVLLNSQYLVILAVTVIAAVFQYSFFKRTLLGKKLQAGMRLRRLLDNKSACRTVRRPEAGWHRHTGSILCGMHRTRESELT